MVEETARTLTREDLLREVVRRTAPPLLPAGAFDLVEYIAAVKTTMGEEISRMTATRWLDADVAAGNLRKGKRLMDGRERLVYWPVG